MQCDRALADSDSMVSDAMRIQRPPHSLPLAFSLCLQTLGLRLYEERMIAVRVDPNLYPKFCACACILTRALREECVVQCKRNQICIPTRCQPSLPDTDTPFLQMRVLQYVRIRICILKFYLRDVSMECGHPSKPVGVDKVFRGFSEVLRYDMLMVFGMLYMIHEVKFVWAAMITPLLPARRRGQNTALIRCNSII